MERNKPTTSVLILTVVAALALSLGAGGCNSGPGKQAAAKETDAADNFWFGGRKATDTFALLTLVADGAQVSVRTRCPIRWLAFHALAVRAGRCGLAAKRLVYHTTLF